MVLLQQAVAYIFRKKTRNIILFLILFLILSCLYFCFSLMQVGGGMKAQIRKSSGASFAPVSYTHLDVYKRQYATFSPVSRRIDW